MVELRRGYEHLDQRYPNRSAGVDCVEGADLSSQEMLCGVDVRTADYVNAPRHGLSSVILTEQLGSVLPPLVSLSTGTELNTLTT